MFCGRDHVFITISTIDSNPTLFVKEVLYLIRPLPEHPVHVQTSYQWYNLKTLYIHFLLWIVWYCSCRPGATMCLRYSITCQLRFCLEKIRVKNGKMLLCRNQFPILVKGTTHSMWRWQLPQYPSHRDTHIPMLQLGKASHVMDEVLVSLWPPPRCRRGHDLKMRSWLCCAYSCLPWRDQETLYRIS